MTVIVEKKENSCMFRVGLTLLTLTLAGCVTTPPVQEMSDARQAIAAAESAVVGRAVPESLDDARRFLVEAEQQIQQQAYGPARFNAIRAKNRASVALRSARPPAANRD